MLKMMPGKLLGVSCYIYYIYAYSFVVVIVIMYDQTWSSAMELTPGADYRQVLSYMLLLTHFTGEVTAAQRADAPLLESLNESQGKPPSLGLHNRHYSSIFLCPQNLPILRQNSAVFKHRARSSAGCIPTQVGCHLPATLQALGASVSSFCMWE